MDGFTASLWTAAVAIIAAPFWLIPQIPRKAHVVILFLGGGAILISLCFFMLVTGFAGGVEQQLEMTTEQLGKAGTNIELVQVETLGGERGSLGIWVAVAYVMALRFWHWLMTAEHQ
ncbi:hypothetical protein [Paracoccus rhizosphaerae]|uniref:Uncharacterized protein n=1 Tax=Paracoccus rhizosphaerae TaxID=1133347 RepID=A0ABV6CL41_9RHOB|nr:hypothetical protein [Paracoccus rhizosphaerae]